jgi:YbbR domain-containing protein
MSFFRGFDFGRFLLALALAAALWWVITTEQNPERHEVFPSPIPVEVINAPPSLVVTGEVPTIQAEVRAPGDAWSRLRSSSFRATADASRAGPGLNELPVTLERLDPAVRAADPVPPRVRVAMEELREHQVPVRVNLTGAVPFGYAAGQARTAPEAVTASGPASAVQRVQEALVEIPLDQLTLSVNSSYQPVPVDARRERVPNVRLSPGTVSVEIPVSQQVSYKEVGVRPVVRGRLASGYYLEPIELNPPSATVVGEPAQLAAVAFVETEPIDVSGLSTTSVKQVFLRAPTGVTFLQPRPVNVTLRVNPIPTTQSLQVQPVVSGLGPGLELADPPRTVELTITGPAPTLQGLSARDFRVALDLAGRGPGQHTIPLQPQVPTGFRLESLNPTTLTVTIRTLPSPTTVPASATPTP